MVTFPTTLLKPFLLSLLIVPNVAWAQDATLPDPYRDTVTIGVGVAVMPDYEGSNDYRFVAAPGAIGTVKGVNFVLAGNQLSVDLIPDKPGPTWDVQLGPIAQLNFDRSSRAGIRDTRVRNVRELGTAIELGGYVGLGKTGVLTSPYDKLSVSLGYRHDVSGVHDSGIWQPSLTYVTPVSTRAAVSILWSADIVERRYARTYYDVTTSETKASGLPMYVAEGGLKNWTIGSVATYSLTGDLLKGWKIVGVATYGRVAGSIGRSPLVREAGSKEQWLGAIGFAYTM